VDELVFRRWPNLTLTAIWTAWMFARYDVMNDNLRLLPKAENVMQNDAELETNVAAISLEI
jgi:hypothetical protein